MKIKSIFIIFGKFRQKKGCPSKTRICQPQPNPSFQWNCYSEDT